jgi:Chaperone of endosialidase
MKTTIPSSIVVAFYVCLISLQDAHAVSPPPDRCYPQYATAEGCNALQSLTTGAGNTAIGWRSLFLNMTGNFNTALGAGALILNNGDSNTATGAAALLLNTSGIENTANGTDALVHNDTGNENTAVGASTLSSNITGGGNSAFGASALLFLTSGGDNTALGAEVGSNLETGSGNVYVGAFVSGVTSEDNHTYIRNINSTSVSGGGTDTVTVNLMTGLLGHLSSSRRHKEQIKPMANSSEILYRLKPVTYRYKKEIDRNQALDYGLVAEEVAEIDPDLTACNRDGQIESVRYSAINAMLLNEFLKEHKAFVEEHRTVEELKKQIEALNAGLQKVSAQLEMSKPAPQTVLNNH